ncbi:hypothetical protein Vretifemale_1889 [Volvox reticuliferus]|nr:hypothetical protein Vretifemale_1889 [Volvox reticuliferus]
MAMVAQSAGYPRNLSYLVKRLSGYSRNTFRLQTLNQTTATAGQIITVDLPSNALVDLSTLTMFFKGATSTTAGFAVFPRNIECLIERLEVEINGQIVNTGCAYYNQLWQILADTTFGTQVLPKSLAGAEQAYALLLNAYNLSQDTLGGGYKNMDTLAKWNAAFWVACQEFDHGTDDYISGIDTRGNVAQCFFETQGTVSTGTAVGTAPTNPGTNLVALVFAQTTSTLRVGAGRMIELVM